MREPALLVWLLPLLTISRPTFADPPTTVLRFAAVAPEGTPWAREGHSFVQIIERETHGAVAVKWYLGGVAGDDAQMGERVRRGQLAGVASGGPLCEQIAPSIRVMHIPGLYRNRDEWLYVLNQLRPQFDQEFERAGFVNLGEAGVGPTILLSRTPIATMEELARARLWLWDTFRTQELMFEEMRFHAVPLPLPSAARAYEDRRIDGFFGIPVAALAFQWSTQARYFSELPINFLALCLIISQKAMDPLPIEHQKALRAAGATMTEHFESVGREQDQALMNGLFERQGLKRIPVSDTFRNDFFAISRAARERLGDKLVPRALLMRVQSLLAAKRFGRE